MTQSARKPHVLLVSFGGTISMEREPHTGRSIPSRSASALMEQTSLAASVEVQCVDAPASLRTIRRSTDLLAVAHFLQPHVRDELDGVVITHGTDALEEVVYFIDEVFSPRVPIVCTGSMRPGWAVDYDGMRNLENALRLASVMAAEYGVLVTMYDKIFEAWSVYKADTTALDAFAVCRGAASGRIRGQLIEMPWRPAVRARFGVVPQTVPTSVPILTMGVGDDGAILDRIDSGSIQGLVVAGMGAGSVPPLAQEKVFALAQQGTPVVLCSSVPSGPTAAEQYYPGDYDELRAAGVAIEDRLNARKTRIRLLLSLGLGVPYIPFGE